MTMENLYALGLIAIVVGWILQYFSTSHSHHEFHPLFLIFYSLGTAILAWVSYKSGSPLTSILNLASFVIPTAILLRVSK